MNYTLYKNGRRVETGTLAADDNEAENDLVCIFPGFSDQRFDGFGGAVTDSAAYVFSLMTKEEQDQLIDAYFGEDGLRYNMVRVPIDSCDFSLEQYETAPGGDLSKFDLTRPLKYILPMLTAIREKYDFSLMLSPWSPPAAWKTNGQRTGGGRLRKEYYPAWAAYLCRYVETFETLGFHVAALSLQNEPHAVQTWDSCLYTAKEERAFFEEALLPALRSIARDDIEVYIWDHNKERALERAAEMFRTAKSCGSAEPDDAPATKNAPDGLAFHWYSGDHFESLQEIHRHFPEKKLMLSENCIEYSKFEKDDSASMRSMIAHEFIGDLRSGTTRILDWNMLLDEQGGPNYVKNYCHAPFLFDTKKRVLMRQPTYEVLWHFAQFVQGGARRIAASSYDATLECVAFALQEGGIVVIFLDHRPEGSDNRDFFVKAGSGLLPLSMCGGELVTAILS